MCMAIWDAWSGGAQSWSGQDSGGKHSHPHVKSNPSHLANSLVTVLAGQSQFPTLIDKVVSTVNSQFSSLYGEQNVLVTCNRKIHEINSYISQFPHDYTIFQSFTYFHFLFSKSKQRALPKLSWGHVLMWQNRLIGERFWIYYNMIRNSTGLYCIHRSLWMQQHPHEEGQCSVLLVMTGRSTMRHAETLLLKLTAQESYIFFETSDDCMRIPDAWIPDNQEFTVQN